ncbi:MAG TPA: alpha/beta fold hydrolase [Candidatus Angelobacter sp.]|nr:alpha/beta fold hydrolase [Candidatus Angelobacter sp.]
MLFVPLALYLALAIFALLFSGKVIFQPHPASYKDTDGIFKIVAASGKKISAVYLPYPGAKFTLLFSHGNAEDLGDNRYWLNELNHAGFNVLAYDYEGYGTSEGAPSEKSVYQDEEAAYDYLVQDLHIAPNRVIVLGRSVGSGPATYLAARRPVAALVLESPFVSAFRVLTRIPIFPWDKFPNGRNIHQVQCPVLIIHGTADRIVAFWHGKKLYEMANEPKRYLWIDGGGHNDLVMVAGKRYLQALKDFAASLAEGSRGQEM